MWCQGAGWKKKGCIAPHLPAYKRGKWQLTPISNPSVVWRVPVSPHAAHSDVRGSLLFKPSSLIPEEAEGSRVNGAPRSRALIGGKGWCGRIAVERSVPRLMRPWTPPLRRRFSRPPDQIRFLPAINLESGGPRSTLITTRSPQQRGFDPAAPLDNRVRQRVRECGRGKLSYDNRRWANSILTPCVHTAGPLTPPPPSFIPPFWPPPPLFPPPPPTVVESPALSVYNCPSP